MNSFASFLSVLIFLLSGPAFGAEPTELREWSAISGHRTQARALSATAEAVKLERENGSVIEIPLDRLVPSDRELLHAHFGNEAPGEPAAGEPVAGKSSAASEVDFPHPFGEISGPLESAPGSTYLIYLPKSLKEGRKAPILHFNGSGGGNPGEMKRYLSAVERFGWVLVASVESKNGNSFDVNHAHAANNIAHLKKFTWIDPERIYFTGQSGGGAMCWKNASMLKAAGTMPVMSYIQSETKISRGHHFIMIGATDYNRYLSGHAGSRFGKDAFVRCYPGGHSFPRAEDSHVFDEGIAWLTAKYLDANASDRSLADDRLDYEAVMIKWIEEISESLPHQAFHLCAMLGETYQISGPNASIVTKMQSSLRSSTSNSAYRDGLLKIHDFCVKEFASLGTGGGSAMGSNDEGNARKLTRLATEFAGVPFVEETLTEMAKPTVGQ